jgi:hypothetical protein
MNTPNDEQKPESGVGSSALFCECMDFRKACETDSGGWGARIWQEGGEWRAGCDLPPLRFCPWCAKQVPQNDQGQAQPLETAPGRSPRPANFPERGNCNAQRLLPAPICWALCSPQSGETRQSSCSLSSICLSSCRMRTSCNLLNSFKSLRALYSVSFVATKYGSPQCGQTDADLETGSPQTKHSMRKLTVFSAHRYRPTVLVHPKPPRKPQLAHVVHGGSLPSIA